MFSMLGTPRFEGMASEGSLEQIGSGITVSFMIPAGMSADTLSILFWDGNEWIEVDGASQVGNRLDVQVDYSGSFVLVSG